MIKQKFGGEWTVEKLDILSKYLSAYSIALKNFSFSKIYIDAFAGTGKIIVDETEEEITGSVRLSLNSENKFDEYIFIEKKKSFAEELQYIVNNEYAELSNQISIIHGDWNNKLIEICKTIDWNNNRAVLFLDPYATEVKWETLKAVAATEAIDLWYLFPFSATQRMLKKDGMIDEKWKLKLNSLFGDDGWFDRFYAPNDQINFFGNDTMIKNVNKEGLSSYIKERLNTIFPVVAKNPRLLYNTMNSPLFLFCFAIANKNKGAQKLALRIAEHILKEEE